MVKPKQDEKLYTERDDIEKIQSNWRKIKGLLGNEEWSSAIVRAVTATEIAANLVIREELIDCRNLDAKLVDHFLRWANGIQGKFDKLIIPTIVGKGHAKSFKALRKQIEDINLARNSIVHTGSFSSGSASRKIVSEAKVVIEALIEPYYDNFKLKDLS